MNEKGDALENGLSKLIARARTIQVNTLAAKAQLAKIAVLVMRMRTQEYLTKPSESGKQTVNEAIQQVAERLLSIKSNAWTPKRCTSELKLVTRNTRTA